MTRMVVTLSQHTRQIFKWCALTLQSVTTFPKACGKILRMALTYIQTCYERFKIE